MARIAGVNIPTNKRVIIALQYIHGIGPKFAREIVTKVGLADDRRVNQLTDAEVLQIREAIDADYQVEGDLRREVSMNIKRLMDLGCYRIPMRAPVRALQRLSQARRNNIDRIFRSVELIRLFGWVQCWSCSRAGVAAGVTAV